MAIFREIPPTAGFPLGLTDAAKALFAAGTAEDLEDDFRKYLGAPYAKLVSSGTAALYLILEALKKLSRNRRVIIPAYTCPSVAMAVIRAGLVPEVCDIKEGSTAFDLEKLADICGRKSDILAVVPSHIGGIPVDIDGVRRASGGRGIFIIEDCAQSLGASIGGKKAGSLGDFAFFSLARGKGLTIYEGGVIITNNAEYAAAIDEAVKEHCRAAAADEALKIFELFGYSVFYRPALFWFVYRLPEMFWRSAGMRLKADSEYFTGDFPVHEVSDIRARVGHGMFGRLDAAVARQRKKALGYTDRLGSVKGVSVLKEPANGFATYPFVTLLFEDIQKRQDALALLERSGSGVSELYTLPAADYGYLDGKIEGGDCPCARSFAQRQMILSTNDHIKAADMDVCARRLSGIMGR